MNHTGITELAATVALPGLARPLRIMHITDSHVDLGLDHGVRTYI
jgi:hypothetical protein